VERVSGPLLVFEADGVLVDASGAWIAAPGTLEALSEQFRLAIAGPAGVSTLPRLAAANAGAKLYYVGKSVAHASAAREAGVPFIGITAPSDANYLDLVFAFQELGAYAIVDNINYLHEVFAS
jgi:phosphoglycolate phosphatase-like HAD superfamily hydrolase